jgi:hypothetical protein
MRAGCRFKSCGSTSSVLLRATWRLACSQFSSPPHIWGVASTRAATAPPASRYRSRTEGVTTTALAPRTRADTNAGVGTYSRDGPASERCFGGQAIAPPAGRVPTRPGVASATFADILLIIKQLGPKSGSPGASDRAHALERTRARPRRRTPAAARCPQCVQLGSHGPAGKTPAMVMVTSRSGTIGA